jgi:hypothetical protein
MDWHRRNAGEKAQTERDWSGEASGQTNLALFTGAIHRWCGIGTENAKMVVETHKFVVGGQEIHLKAHAKGRLRRN